MKASSLLTVFLLVPILAIAPLRGAEVTAPPPNPPATANVGSIVATKVSGTVTLTADGSTRPLKSGEPVPMKSVLKTAASSAALLTFSNGAMVNVDANGEVAIEVFSQEAFAPATTTEEPEIEPSPSRVLLRLLRGELAGQMKRLRGQRGASFTVATEAGVLWTQRGGATFLAAATAAEVIVTVAEGEMNFRPPGKEPINVTAGNQLRAAVVDAELLGK